MTLVLVSILMHGLLASTKDTALATQHHGRCRRTVHTGAAGTFALAFMSLGIRGGASI